MLGLPSFTPTFISLGIDIPVDESNLLPGGVTQGRCRNGSSTPLPNMTLWARLVPRLLPLSAHGNLTDLHGPAPVGADSGWSEAIGARVDLRRRPLSTLCLGDEYRQRLCPAPHRLAHKTQPVCAFQCLAGFEQAVYYLACHIGQRCALVHLDILALAEAK